MKTRIVYQVSIVSAPYRVQMRRFFIWRDVPYALYDDIEKAKAVAIHLALNPVWTSGK